jgi:hemolysin activation/secretion protein
LGYQYSNLFRRDHTITLSYTTCPDRLSDVQQYGVHYRAPFYRLGAALSLFYTRSEVDQGTIAEFFEVSGEGTFMGAGVDVILPPVGDLRHKLFLEVQDREFENDVFFGRDPTPLVPDVRSRPATLNHSGRLEGTWGEAAFRLGYTRNLVHGAHNNAEAYAATRAGADPHWDAFRYSAHLYLNLPLRFELRGRLSGQVADEPLIPGERFGLGGLRSVRGFEEREVSGDTCEEGHLELWSPTLGPGLRLLGFVDAGRARLDRPIPGLPDEEHLSSVGLGLRWQWRRHVHLLVDAAHVTNGAGETNAGDGRIHFSLFLRF